jgi:hypothetical protein
MSARKRTFLVVRGFTCPTTLAGLKRAQGERLQPGDKAIEWQRHEIGEVLPEPFPALLASWLANKLVEEVK